MFMPSDQSFQHHHYLIPQQPPNLMAAIGIATPTTASANCWILPSSSSSSCFKDPQSAPNCPRCASSNTKFCYYNNYSLAQPRYFCKGCRRYWTKGGSLRNVPIGQGCRKTRRRSPSSSSIKSSRSQGQDSSSSSESSDGGRSSSNNKVVEIDVAAVFNQYLNQDINPNSPVPNPLIASSLPSISMASSKLLTETTGDLLQHLDHLLPEECNIMKQQQQQQEGTAADEDHAMDQYWDAGITLAEDTTTLWSSSPQPPLDNNLYLSSPNWPLHVEDLGGLPHLLGDTNWTNNCLDLTAHEDDIF